MPSSKKKKTYDKGIRSLLQAMRSGVLDDYSISGKPSMGVPPQTGPIIYRPDASQVLPPQYPSQVVPAQSPAQAVAPQAGPIVYRPDASQVVPPQYPPQSPLQAIILEDRATRERGGNKVPLYVPDPSQAAPPQSPAQVIRAPAVRAPVAVEDRASREPRYEQPVYNLDPNPYAAAAGVLPPDKANLPGRANGVIAGNPEWWGDRSRFGPQFNGSDLRDTLDRGPYFRGDPNAAQAAIDNAYVPAVAGSGGIHAVLNPPETIDPNAIRDVIDAAPVRPEEEGWPKEGWLRDLIWPKKEPPTFEPTPPQTPPGRLSDEYSPNPETVLPPDEEGDQPAVVPVTDTPPEIDPSGLPGVSTETATGALSLDDYIAKMKQAYPDLDFTNPKQAEADANARRDLDRTAILARLQMAAGMVSGAGPSWKGIGEGFGNAAGAYDKGFTKYQQALQDSADRYHKQMESQMTYDTARRQAALGLYTSATEQAAEDRRAIFKESSQRQWDYWKFGKEGERETWKTTQENINKYFDREFDAVKPATDPSNADPVEEQRKEMIRRDILERREASTRAGKIFKAQYDVATK